MRMFPEQAVMSDGFVRLYRRDWSPDQVHRRVESPAAAGMVLRHPRTGRITAISFEPGKPVPFGGFLARDTDGIIALTPD